MRYTKQYHNSEAEMSTLNIKIIETISGLSQTQRSLKFVTKKYRKSWLITIYYVMLFITCFFRSFKRVSIYWITFLQWHNGVNSLFVLYVYISFMFKCTSHIFVNIACSALCGVRAIKSRHQSRSTSVKQKEWGDCGLWIAFASVIQSGRILWNSAANSCAEMTPTVLTPARANNARNITLPIQFWSSIHPIGFYGASSSHHVLHYECWM